MICWLLQKSLTALRLSEVHAAETFRPPITEMVSWNVPMDRYLDFPSCLSGRRGLSIFMANKLHNLSLTQRRKLFMWQYWAWGYKTEIWESERKFPMSSDLAWSVSATVPRMALPASQGRKWRRLHLQGVSEVTGLNQQSEKYWCVNQRETVYLRASCLV